MWGRRRRRRRVGRRRKRKVVWWRVASWQLCREKTDPPLLPPQTVFLGGFGEAFGWNDNEAIKAADPLRARLSSFSDHHWGKPDEHPTHKRDCIAKTCLQCICLSVCLQPYNEHILVHPLVATVATDFQRQAAYNGANYCLSVCLWPYTINVTLTHL